MKYIYRLELIFCAFIILAVLWGCAPKPTKSTTPVPSKIVEQEAFADIEIPSAITSKNVSSLEQLVFSLGSNHPQRRKLRDDLVAYHVDIFSALGETEEDARMEQFAFILALHEPADFRRGDVAGGASIVAQWVVANFKSQGKEAYVLAGLIYLSLANPENVTYEQRYLSLLDWSQQVRKTIKDPIERHSSISQMYASVARLLPHKEVIERLANSLAARQKAVVQFLQVFAGNSGGFSPMMFHSVISKGGIGKEFVQAFFLGDYLDEALDRMEDLDIISGIEEELVSILTQLKNKENVPYNYHRLAQLLGPGNPVAGMRACMKSAQLAPNEPRYSLCVGRFFSKMGRQLPAIDYFAKAVKRDNGAMLAQAMELVQDSLYQIHMGEHTEDMAEALQRTEEIVQMVQDKNSEDDAVAMAASALIETAAIIEFDDGNIESAKEHFVLASSFWPSRPTPVAKIAEIYYWEEDYTKAVEFISDALTAKNAVGGAYADYWKAILFEQRGDCYLALKQHGDAVSDYQRAQKQWDIADYPDEHAPVIAIRKGVLFSRLGKQEESTIKFREAIQLSPDRRASYAEIISFLVVSERLEDAKEFYRLAFNQDMLATMWKIYFSIWVDGLSRLENGVPFDLALGYLENSSDKSWQDNLATFFTGTIDDATLRNTAQSKGQFVEADYYVALLAAANGKPELARPLLQKVLDSKLFAFFEYRMAKELLKKL